MENVKFDNSEDEGSFQNEWTDVSEEDEELNSKTFNEVETVNTEDKTSPSHSMTSQGSRQSNDTEQKYKNSQEIEQLIAELDRKSLLNCEQPSQVQEDKRKSQQSNLVKSLQPTQKVAESSQNQHLNPGEPKQHSQPLAASHIHLQGQQLHHHHGPHLAHQLQQSQPPGATAWPLSPAGFQMWNQAPQPWMNQPQPAQTQVGAPSWYQNMGRRPVAPYPPQGPSCYYVSRPAFPPYPNNVIHQEYAKPQPKPEVVPPLQSEKQPTQPKANQEERKSVDVKEQSVVSEIYNITKKYLESKDNNDATNSELEPQHLSNSAEKQVDQSSEQNNKADTNINPENDEVGEPNGMVIPKTTGEELMGRLATIDSQTLDLTRWITSLTTRLKAVESSSVKLTESQAKLDSLKSVNPQLEALELKVSETATICAALEKRFLELNMDMIELLKVVSNLQSRWEATSKAERESKQAADRLEARLDILEMLVAVSSSNCSRKTTEDSDEDTLGKNIFRSHPNPRRSNKRDMKPKSEYNEESARPIKETPNTNSVEESAHHIKEEPDQVQEEVPTIKEEITGIVGVKPDAVLNSVESDQTEGAVGTSIQCSETKTQRTCSETIVQSDSIADGDEAHSGSQLNISENGPERRKYSRNELLCLSCHPLSLKKPQNLPQKLYRRSPAELYNQTAATTTRL
uniref:Uncharacterized protein n=1 Tax=Graphocephala atropunctata TaxID=36148 RepID=A0A1B6MHI9_9HEMI